MSNINEIEKIGKPSMEQEIIPVSSVGGDIPQEITPVLEDNGVGEIPTQEGVDTLAKVPESLEKSSDNMLDLSVSIGYGRELTGGIGSFTLDGTGSQTLSDIARDALLRKMKGEIPSVE
jgi:hypothetical protein